MIHVVTQSFCGMTVPHGEFESVADARDRVQKRLKWLEREEFEVEQLDPYTWEVNSDGMVSQHCGLLMITNKQPRIQ